MTVTAASLEAPYGERAAGRPDRWAFALGVLMVLIYSQAVVAPLSGETGDPEASGLIGALYYAAYAAAAVLILAVWRRSLLALSRAPLLIALVALAASSALWSVAPDITVRRSAALAFTCLSGVALAARFSWARLTEVLAFGFALLALASLGAGLFVPSIGRMSDLVPGAWRGLWFDKDALGQYMTAGFCACTAAAELNPGRRRLWGAAAALTILLVLLSTSETSLASLTLATGMLGFVWLVRRGPAAGIAAVWLAVLVAGFLVLEPDRAFALLGKDATLTGRTRIWAAILRRIHERPAFGWGYGAVWDNKDLWAPLARIGQEAGFVARRAQTSWIEQALGLGVTGLALWSLWFVETILRALFALFTRRSAYLAAPYLAAYALTTLTASVTLIWNELTWVMFVAVAVKLALGERPPQFAAAMRASPAAP